MKRISTIVMALTLVLGLSQCKKNDQNNVENQNDPVTITLNVSGNNGSKVIVNPATGTVDFENNDQIIVASGGKYVGTLTYNGSLFTGAISNATEGYPLQFYFLGNLTPTETLTAGITESCSVIISDQTEHLPVISAAPSNENYTASTTDYTAHLLNKCALVKFNVTTASEAATCVTGFNNKVTVNFSENTLTNSQESNGVVTLPAGNGEKWAILLPNEALESGESGSAYSVDSVYTGTRGAVPAISNNMYLTMGIEVEITSFHSGGEKWVNLGLPSGILWATCNVGANNPEEYGDYFAWAETQPKSVYSGYNYIYYIFENTWHYGYTKYCPNSDYGYNNYTDNLTILQPCDDAAAANYGGRTPTEMEWRELRDNCTSTWTTLNGINGQCLTGPNGNSIFLPNAGYRYEGELRNVGIMGQYWSSSLNINDPQTAWEYTDSGNDYIYQASRPNGLSVRAVHSAK